jgi:hypothetical protein
MEKKAVGVRTREHKEHWLTKEGHRMTIYDKGEVELLVATDKYFHLTFKGNKLNGTYKMFPLRSKRGDNWLLVKPKSVAATESTELLDNLPRPLTLTEQFLLTEVIVKKGSKWCLYSKDGSRNLGCYPDKEGAAKRERQVQYFKHMKGK